MSNVFKEINIPNDTMNTVCLTMSVPEQSVVKKIGNSIGVYLDRGILEKVYGITVGSPIEIVYNFPNIIIRIPKKKKEKSD